jgi:hypothetical protein
MLAAKPGVVRRVITFLSQGTKYTLERHPEQKTILGAPGKTI